MRKMMSEEGKANEESEDVELKRPEKEMGEQRYRENEDESIENDSKVHEDSKSHDAATQRAALEQKWTVQERVNRSCF